MEMKTKMNRAFALLLAICLLMSVFPAAVQADSDNFKFATATSLDGRPYPAYDYSRANKLPAEMTGYWEKSFDVNGEIRTAKVYISPETPIRSYFTVIAVPDGVNTAEFLWKSTWKELADTKEEGLFVLEPGKNGWGSPEDEQAYVNAAMSFFQSNRYFSIYGEHYLVGYGQGAPALEAWAVAHPLRVISQVYIDSRGLSADYLNQYANKEFDGTTDAGYTTVVFPEGFKLVKYSETVQPTRYIHPDTNTITDSLAYWKAANDTEASPVKDLDLGLVYKQVENSGRWMTSYSGSISKVAVLDRPVSYWDKLITSNIDQFMTFYTRYENFFAYGNQLYERANYAKLGVEIHTMMVNGFIREYSVYVPESAKQIWGDAAPVLFVWPGNSQTDKVFFDATQWWKIAEKEGFVLVTICEQYSSNSVSVSHKDSNIFYQQLREVLINNYPVDPTRFYSTGQSAGSMLSQSFVVGKPEYYAAVASTSGAAAPNAAGNISIDGVSYPAAKQMIPNYMIYGYGDMGSLYGDLWDATSNQLDSWANYNLTTDGFTLNDVDTLNGVTGGWFDRFKTWTWSKTFGGDAIPLFKLTKDVFRSHNCIQEEMPMLWDFMKHYSSEVDANGNVTRYYSPSGFKAAGDKVRILP